MHEWHAARDLQFERKASPIQQYHFELWAMSSDQLVRKLQAACQRHVRPPHLQQARPPRCPGTTAAKAQPASHIVRITQQATTSIPLRVQRGCRDFSA